MLGRLLKKTDGKKTYAAAVAMAVFAVLGLYLGQLDQAEAVRLLVEAAAIVGLRDAIAKL